MSANSSKARMSDGGKWTSVRIRHGYWSTDRDHDECCPHNANCWICGVPFPCPTYLNHGRKPHPPIKANKR